MNLDKREFIDPHRLGAGLKLWEQLATHPGTGAALLVLLAVMPEARGGGDLKEDPVIGRWAGDRVVLVGDYSIDEDLTASPIPFGQIYDLTDDSNDGAFTDITADVAKVIERELEGRFVGHGWMDFKPVGEAVADKLTQGMRPDLVVGAGQVAIQAAKAKKVPSP